VSLFGCIAVALTMAVVAHSAAGHMTTFAATQSHPTGKRPDLVAVADVNGDGRIDVVSANGGKGAPETLSVLLNHGGGRFPSHVDYLTHVTAHGATYDLVLGDLNADGTVDIATANGGANTVSVFLNRGHGTYREGVAYRAGAFPTALAIGDLNRDRKPDLIAADCEANSLLLLFNNGHGRFGHKRSLRVGECPTSVAIGDLNRDHALDLAAAADDSRNTLSVLLGRANGTFRPRRDYQLGGPEENLDSVAIGDLNRDQAPDLAVADGQTDSVLVLLNNGTGRFRWGHSYRAGKGPLQVRVADVNRDRRLDLVVADFTASTSLLLGRGDGSFEASLDYPLGGGSLAIGDLNRDRRQDLVGANFRRNTISVLLNRPGLCNVQAVKGMMLTTARPALTRAGCSTGRMRGVYSANRPKGFVIRQKPKFGAALPGGSKVSLTVSLGRKD
jgi:hypothetical protein